MTPRYSNRWHTWLLPGERIVCPKGHHLRTNSVTLQHDALICQHVEPHQKGQCGARIYVMAMPHGLRFLAEVTAVETMAMRDNCFTVEQALEYLRGKAA